VSDLPNPFGLGPDPLGIEEGDLLWRQLMSYKKWNELGNALQAMSERDLRLVVLSRVAAEYKAPDPK
jgi:hypothetical protein